MYICPPLLKSYCCFCTLSIPKTNCYHLKSVSKFKQRNKALDVVTALALIFQAKNIFSKYRKFPLILTKMQHLCHFLCIEKIAYTMVSFLCKLLITSVPI